MSFITKRTVLINNITFLKYRIAIQSSINVMFVHKLHHLFLQKLSLQMNFKDKKMYYLWPFIVPWLQYSQKSSMNVSLGICRHVQMWLQLSNQQPLWNLPTPPPNFTSMAALSSDKVTIRLFVLLLCITSDTCIHKINKTHVQI